MEFALAILLVSSLTSIGLLALWAATSPRHWFLRTAVFLGVVSLLLLIPAYEPWVAFVLQGAVVAVGIQGYRWRNQTGDSTPSKQFSLATLLQVFVVVAVVAAVGAKLPVLDSGSWTGVLTIGAAGGLSTLIATWVVRGSRYSVLSKVFVGLIVVLLLAALVSAVDWFILAVLSQSGWPVIETVFGFMGIEHTAPIWIFLQVYAIELGITAMILWLGLSTATCRPVTTPGTVSSELGLWPRLPLALIGSVLTCLPAAYVYWELVNPLPIPETNLPDPNGYDDLQAAWTMLPTNPLVDGMNFDAEKNALTGVSKAVEEAMPALTRARKGLAKPCMFRLDYSCDLVQLLPDIQKTRCLARAFEAEGVLAKRSGNYANALESQLDLIAYGYATRRGRMVMDELIGIACAGLGRSGIYSLRDDLQVEQINRAIKSLNLVLEDTEPHDNFVYRDKVWTQRSQGWYGQLMLLLDKFADGDSWSFKSAERAVLREQAEMRLLIAELAVRAHVLQHGQPPAQIAEVEHLPDGRMPIDPFSPEGAALGYVQENDSYILYSVGPNRIDENGASPDPNDVIYKVFETGDFRLDLFYTPDEDPNAGE